MAVDMSVYKLNSEKNKVNKTVNSGDLSLVTTYQGTLKDETDLMKPSILLELPAVPAFNYVYITQLGRYYFVRDYSIVRNGLYRINLREDVLTSFGSKILQQGAILSRYESDENPMLVDSKRPFSSAISLTSSTLSPYIATHTFNQANLTSSSLCYVVTLATSPRTTVYNTNSPNPFQFNSPYCSNKGLNGISWVCSKDDVKEIIAYLNTTDWTSAIAKLIYGQSSQGVISIMAFPFAIDVYESALTNVTMFNNPINSLQCHRLDENSKFIMRFSNYVPGTASSFMDLEPYTRYKIYLPYIGFEDLDAKDLTRSSSGVGVAYQVDLLTGEAIAMVYDLTSLRPYKIFNGQVGVNVPISASNALEQSRNTLNNGLNAALGGFNLVAGASTGNIPVAAAGATNIIRSGVQQVQNTLTMRGSVSSGSLAQSMFYLPFIMKETQVDLAPTDYGHLVGYPSMIYKTLSTLSGYAEINSIHLDGFTTATEAEIDEIENLLKSGVIF